MPCRSRSSRINRISSSCFSLDTALKSLVITHNGVLTAIRKTKVDYLRNNYPDLQSQFVGGRHANPEEELAKLDIEMMEMQKELT